MQTQPLLTTLTRSATFLVLELAPSGEQAATDLLADLSGLVRSIGFRAPDGRLSCIAGVGSAAWDRLFAGPRPSHLHEFIPLDGPVHQAVSTPGDLFFHIRAERQDLCFELATAIMHRLAGVAVVADEVVGFRYFEQRDLLGFVDGTENPTGRVAADAVLIGDEDTDFAGGSYVVVQKYLHDMSTWNALTTEDQERAIGRTKLADFEMSDEEKPANSHIALNVITDDEGNELKILRDNMPFGSIKDGESGTYFIGYARDPLVTETMLRNMFLGNPPGNYDRILDFSTAVTGSLFFIPSADFLDDPPVATDDSAATPSDSPELPDHSDLPAGSLNIGSLKRSMTHE